MSILVVKQAILSVSRQDQHQQVILQSIVQLKQDFRFQARPFSFNTPAGFFLRMPGNDQARRNKYNL